MRRIAIAVLGMLVAGSIAGRAQQSGPSPATFRAGTTLVDFNIVATDSKGNPVTDLRRDEIAVLDDDQLREIAFFQFEGAAASSSASPAGSPAALPAGTFTNRIEYAARPPKNLIAIVVDLINTSIGQQVELQTQLLHHLKQLPPDAHVGLYVISEHAVALHDFTQDAESLRARLEKSTPTVQTTLASSARVVQQLLSTGSPQHAEALRALAESDARIQGDLNQQFMKTRRRLTLEALESVGHHLAGIPGRKSLVWISFGFPLTDFFGTYTDQVSSTAHQLATQNVAVYPVDAQGVPLDRRPIAQGRIEGTSELIASITGGRATRNNNDLMHAVMTAADDVRGTYSLGFYPANSTDNRWHRLSVTVTRPGVIVRHRQGYLASADVGPASDLPHERWNDLAFRPLTSTGVRVDVRPTREAARLSLALDVVVDDLQFRPADGGSAADVEIALVEKTAKGPTNVRVQTAGIQVPAGAAVPAVVPFSATFPLNAQTTSVRVIVRDRASGKLGSLDLPLDKLPKP